MLSKEERAAGRQKCREAGEPIPKAYREPFRQKLIIALIGLLGAVIPATVTLVIFVWDREDPVPEEVIIEDTHSVEMQQVQEWKSK